MLSHEGHILLLQLAGVLLPRLQLHHPSMCCQLADHVSVDLSLMCISLIMTPTEVYDSGRCFWTKHMVAQVSISNKVNKRMSDNVGIQHRLAVMQNLQGHVFADPLLGSSGSTWGAKL